MVKLTSFHRGIVIGLLLSDGWLQITKRSINSCLFFKQSLDKSGYVWFVFNLLSHYCGSYPFLTSGARKGVKFYGLEFYTRSYPCFTELFWLFYPNGEKLVPKNIYELLCPVALAHMIMGDGSTRDYGLHLCTDSYTLPDVVRIMNVLIIRYRLNCTIQLRRNNQYRIYISSRSMPLLCSIVEPYMHSSMMYKLRRPKKN